MHTYQDVHGRFPPAVVYGEDGRPLYSWRVLLLPYLEQEALYSEFKLDQPWDSEHNRLLLARMPSVYAAPGSKARRIPPDHTFCHVFVGKGAAFEGTRGMRLADDFPDGTSNTFLIVEAGEPVPWTKPEELLYAAEQPLPRLEGPFKDGFRAAFADGHVRFIERQTSEALIRGLITRNGGENLLPMGWNDP